jgi:hypothetical protein
MGSTRHTQDRAGPVAGRRTRAVGAVATARSSNFLASMHRIAVKPMRQQSPEKWAFL